jgi:hypothetical protein
VRTEGARGWVAGLAMAACAACAGHPVAEGHSAAARSLTGTWEARFTADAAPVIARERRVRPVSAEVVLLENRWLGSVAGLSAEPTHYGTFDADFGPLGFDPRAEGQVPSIAAVVMGRDSVELVLQPASGAAPLTAAGHVAGDSVVGRWWHSGGRGVGIAGSFRMRRHAWNGQATAPGAGPWKPGPLAARPDGLRR